MKSFMGSLIALHLVLVGAAAAQTVPQNIGPCMQSAIEARDAAIVGHFETYHTLGKSYLTARKDALKNAWTITDVDQRALSLKNAWKTYRQNLKVARQSFNVNRKAAWDQFRISAKACGVRGADTSEGRSYDNGL